MGIGKNTMKGVVGFGVGYVAGMKIGNRPVRLARRTAAEARAFAGGVAASAERTRARVAAVAATARARSPVRLASRTVDVREVAEVMRPTAGSIGPKATLREAAVLMKRSGLGELVVAKGERVRGVLTDRDIVVRGVARGFGPMTRVSSILTRTDVAVSSAAPMQEALDLMRAHGIARVAVVEAGRSVGVLSLEDSDRAAPGRLSAPPRGVRPPTG